MLSQLDIQVQGKAWPEQWNYCFRLCLLSCLLFCFEQRDTLHKKVSNCAQNKPLKVKGTRFEFKFKLKIKLQNTTYCPAWIACLKIKWPKLHLNFAYKEQVTNVTKFGSSSIAVVRQSIGTFSPSSFSTWSRGVSPTGCSVCSHHCGTSAGRGIDRVVEWW